MIRLLLRAALAAIVLVTVAATPAFADPARPGNTESTVLDVDPPVEGLVVEVTGGDSFLRLVAPSRSLVEVGGYRGEPYLRFDPDGAVYENRNSPAHWMNSDRYGTTPVPEFASAEAEPDWHRVADGGEWAWHDHRIHWMSPELPPTVDGSGPALIQSWSIPMLVDGQEVVTTGDLSWYPSVTPLPWAALAALAAATGWFVARRSVTLTGAAVTLAGLLAVVSSASQAFVSPPGAGGELLSEGAAAAATLLGLVTLTLGRRIPSIGDLPALMGAVVLVMWVVQRIGALWMPILPTPLPTFAERLLVAAVLGLAVAAGAAVLRRRLAPPPVARPATAGDS